MNGPPNLPPIAAPRSRNSSRVLAEIRRRGETARVDIVDALDLSPATVSALVASLIEEGLIIETPSDQGATGRGRPRVALRVNPGACRFAGAKLNDGAITVGVMDFAGAVLSETTVPLAGGAVAPEEMTSTLAAGLDAALEDARLTRADLTALGLGVPGFVDIDAGLCHWSPLLRGTPIDLKSRLEAELGLPVHIDNDANLATLAELWFGHGRSEKNFLVVTIEHGVGLGVVIDGRLFRGARGLGSEFGHIKVQNEGALCRCGQRGCLEAYVADYAIAREAPAALSGSDAAAIGDAPLDQLARRAERGDEVAAAIFQRAGRMLGLGVANLSNLFDPALIVLAGARMKHYHLLAPEMEKAMAANALRTERPPTELRVHRWGDELWARGAGTLAIDRTFEA